MLLRRVSEHVKDQNWFAVAIINLCLWLGLSLAGLPTTAQVQITAYPPSIIGVWQLEELTNYNADGTPWSPLATLRKELLSIHRTASSRFKL